MQYKYTDYILIIILIGVGIFAYDQYKTKTTKIYSVDMVKIFKLKNDELIDLKTNGTKADYDKYFKDYEKIITYTNRYLKNISLKSNTIVFTRQAIYGRSIDLTPRLIMSLKDRNLL